MNKKAIAIVFVLFCLQALSQQTISNQLNFDSPIIPIILKIAVAAPTSAEVKDHLLWYKGKKINDSILITTDAKVVLYSSPRSIVVVQPKSDPSLKMVKRIGDIQKQKEAVLHKALAQKNSFLLYPHVVNTFKQFDQQNEEFGNAIKNVIELPEPMQASARIRTYSSGGVASVMNFVLAEVPVYIKKSFDEVMRDMKNYPPIDFPIPPKDNFGFCYSFLCDSNARKKLDEDKATWMDEFLKYESSIINRSLGISSEIEKKNLSKLPEAVEINEGLAKAMEFARNRTRNKIDLLLRRFENDFERLSAIIPVVIGVERQNQLLGVAEDKSYSELMLRLNSILQRFDNYIEEQMKEKNYDVVLNLAFAIGIERQKQLLGISGDSSGIPEIMDRWAAFNRFKMTYTYETEWAPEGQKEYASELKLESNPFYCALLPVECKLTLIKIDGNALIISEDQLIEMRVITASAPETRYVGAKVLNTHYPTGTITFCNEEGKLVFHNSYHDQDKKWKGKEGVGDDQSIISEALDKAFERPEDENTGKDDEDADEYKYEKAVALKEIKVSDLNSMKAGYENALAVHKAYNVDMYTHEAIVKAQNKNPLIIDEKIDGRKDNPHNYYNDLKTAWLTIKVEHDPLPYKKAGKK